MAVSLAVVAIVLAVALPRSFFEDYGLGRRAGRVGAVRAARPRRVCGCRWLPVLGGRGARRAAEPARRARRRALARPAARHRAASGSGAGWLGGDRGWRWRPDGPRARGIGRARHRRLEGDRVRDRGRRSPPRARGWRSPRATRTRIARRRRRGSARIRVVVRLRRPRRGAGRDRRRRVARSGRSTSTSRTPAGRRRARTRSASPRAQWEAAHRTLVLSPMAFLERLLPGDARARLGPRRRGRLDRRCASRSPRSSSPTRTGPGSIAAFKVLARQVAADGVTLNTVLPGRIATDRVVRHARLARGGRGRRARDGARRPARHGRGARRRGGLPLLGARGLRHRHDAARRRRPHRIRLSRLDSAARRAVSSIGRARDFRKER